MASLTLFKGQKSPPKEFSADINIVAPETWTPELDLQRRAWLEGALSDTEHSPQLDSREVQPGWLWPIQQTQGDDGGQGLGARGGSKTGLETEWSIGSSMCRH